MKQRIVNSVTDGELAQLTCREEAIPSTVEPGTYYLSAQDLDAFERPLLLHPFVDADLSQHLEFRPTGQVRGRTKKGEWSIKVVALNREPREAVTRLLGARRPFLSTQHAALEDALAHEREQLEDD